MKSFLTIIFFTSFFFGLNFGFNLKSNKIAWAINCGSSQPLTGSDGVPYQSDKGCNTGRTANYQESRELQGASIKYTDDSQIYMTERHDDQSFTYSIPLKQSGSYVLILKFSENHFRESGKRQFNIKLGKTVAVKALDIVQQSGAITAHDEYIPFEYDDITRQVLFQNKNAVGAVDLSGNLQVLFEQIRGKDNPMVQGIVLFKGKLEDTDYHLLDQYKKAWDQREQQMKREQELEKQRKEEARFKKREKVKIRNDAFDDERQDEEIELDDDVFISFIVFNFQKEIFVKEQTFTDYFFSPIGFLGLVVVIMVAWFIYSSATKVEKLDLSQEEKIQQSQQSEKKDKSKSNKKKKN